MIVDLTSYNEETNRRAGNFLLVPADNSIPIIINQPHRTLQQTSWIQSNVLGKIKYQSIGNATNVVKAVVNTNLFFEITAADISVSTEPLTYQWTKDGAQLSLYNKDNNRQGTNRIQITNSKVQQSGTYVCKVINKYGSIESVPLSITIIDPKKEIMLYRNLIVNSDGDGGLANWEGDSDIITSQFIKSGVAGHHLDAFGSFNFGGPILFEPDQHPDGIGPTVQRSFTPERLSTNFHFSMLNNYGLFFKRFYDRYNNEPDFKDPSKYTIPTAPSWPDSWYPPQILQNEDLWEVSNYAGFFPGLGWMDKYNKNKNLIGLLSEVENKSPSYFTRDKIKFKKFDGKSIAKFSQNIDLAPVADMINGSVAGIAHVTSQFFAYVGAGITGYKIKVITVDGPIEYNYHIAGSEQLYDYYVMEYMRASNPEYKTGQTNNTDIYVKLAENTPIEITPLVDDTTDITIDYLHADGRILKSETIPGPRAKEVWAIKEKVYFPLTLHFLSQLTLNGDHAIKVFGQTYTYTNAINAMFNRGVEGLFNDSIALGTKQAGINTVVDKNANFILKKYNITTWATQPNQWWAGWNAGVETQPTYTTRIILTNDLTSIEVDELDTPSATNSTNRQKTNKTIIDLGAAAMFGVGQTIKVPIDTTSVKITVAFTNTSEAADDQNPELKGWTKEEIYCNDFGKTQDTSRRTSEYGNPRCGVTKMKFQLFDNNINISENHLTYDIPPANFTVLGMQKEKYMDTHAFNTAYYVTGGGANPTLAPDFNYNLVIPEILPEPIPTVSPFIQNQLNDGKDSIMGQSAYNATLIPAVLTDEVQDSHGNYDDRTEVDGVFIKAPSDKNAVDEMWPYQET